MFDNRGASVVVQQLHKFYVARANIIDERQRGLRDGCAENVIVLNNTNGMRRPLTVTERDYCLSPVLVVMNKSSIILHFHQG